MRVYVHEDPASRVEWEVLCGFLRHEARVEVERRDDVFCGLKGEKLEAVAEGLAKLRVLEPHRQRLNEEPYSVERAYERRNLLRRRDRTFGPIYGGYGFQALVRGLLPEEERSLRVLSVVFTNQRLATWEGGRWHLRTILLGFPTVVSTTGVVEAPAREREYYVLSSVDRALAERWLAEQGHFLEYDDPRLTDVLKGYLWQALFYHRAVTRGEGFRFCPDESCSLYNSHRQREVLQAQLGGRLCEAHRRRWEAIGRR